MSEFHEPLDPKTLPLRRCASCGADMAAVDAGSSSFQPMARYVCSACGHDVKLSTLASAGRWFAIGLVAWAAVSGLLLHDKNATETRYIWMALLLVGFTGPFVFQAWKIRRYPVVNGSEAGPGEGLVASMLFMVLLFVVAMLLVAGFRLV